MATQTYPSYGKLVSWSQAPQRSPVYRTEMERGPAKQVKFSGKLPVNYQVVYVYSASEHATWRTFFNTNIKFGAEWFNWTNPFTNATVEARIVDGKFSVSPVNAKGTHIKIEMTFEVLE